MQLKIKLRSGRLLAGGHRLPRPGGRRDDRCAADGADTGSDRRTSFINGGRRAPSDRPPSDPPPSDRAPFEERLDPTQSGARSLLSAREAMSLPSEGSAPVSLIPASRPITGERTVLPVLGRSTGTHGIRWLRVMIPGRPNGRTGWIEQSGTVPSTTAWHIVVETARRRVVVYDAGKAVRTFSAIVGTPSTPTPLGVFFVEEVVQMPPTSPGAPYALALSARSAVFQTFDGGPGQIAIHGLENVGGVLGTDVSHGCVRLANAAMDWLVLHIASGVPVTVTS